MARRFGCGLCLEVGGEPAEALRFLGGLQMLGRVVSEGDRETERGAGRPGQLGLDGRVEAAKPRELVLRLERGVEVADADVAPGVER